MMKHLPGLEAEPTSRCYQDVGSRQTMRRKIHSVITVCFPVCVGRIPGSVLGGGASIISPVPHSISRTVFKPALPSTPPQFVLLPLVFHRIHLLLCSLFGAASVCFLLYSLPNDQLDYLPALLPVISPWMPSGEQDLHISTCYLPTYDTLTDASLRSRLSKPAKFPFCRSLCASP